MKNLLSVAAAMTATALLAGGAVLALGGADDGGEPQVRSDEAADCPELPCDDTGDGGLAICIEGATDCVDTIDGDGSKCAEGYDCDEPVSGEPVTIIDDQDPNQCNFVHNIDVCEQKAAALAVDDLSARLGIEVGTIAIISAEFTDWPNSCLGVQSPNEICLQVITPGFKVVLEHDGATYEYHTDSGTTALLAE